MSEAQAQYEAALALDPGSAFTLFHRGLTLEGQGRLTAAIASYQQAFYKLFLALKRSDPQQSESYLARFKSASSAEQRRKQADSLGSMGSKFARSGEWQLAVSNFDEALRVCGDCDLAWQLRKDLGLSLCNAGDLVRGEKELRIVNEQKPDDPEITVALRLIERSKLKEIKTSH